MMKLVEDSISISELQELSDEFFGDYVKAVIDIDKEVGVFGGELHSDEEAMLLESGSHQENLWGINIYPSKPKSEWIEYDSMINLRPRQNNRSRAVEDPDIRKSIVDIVNKLVVS